MLKMACNCVSEPPMFDLPPPPDPSLVWHLISDEPFENIDECSSSQFVSISDIGSNLQNSSAVTTLSSKDDLIMNLLIACAVFSIMLLIIISAAVIQRVRQRRRVDENGSTKKASSSNSILVSREHLWTYNSMTNPQKYSDNPVVFHAPRTPSTMRSFVGTAVPQKTLRINPNDTCSAYHTITMTRPCDVYEEIEPIGYMTTRGQNVGRMSTRRPPPTCRPPMPPQSPAQSDSSVDKELTRITNVESPRQWDDGAESSSRSNDGGGRESGYGTAPSLQWKSPSGSGRIDLEFSRSPYVMATKANPHTMTYV